MKNAIRLSVEKPCMEKFDNFDPTSVGGFCGSCQKEVIDFTAMSSEEILRHFSNVAGNTCGRFKSSQLKTYAPIMNSKVNNNLVSRGIAIMGFSLLSLCVAPNLQAQEVAVVTPPLHNNLNSIQQDIVMGKIAINKKTVTGTVLDEENLPLPGVNVILKGTAEGVVTDFDGKFEFPRALNVNDILVFSYIGYETKEYKVANSESDVIDITITFDQSDITLMGEVVVGGVYVSKPNIFQKFVALFKK